MSIIASAADIEQKYEYWIELGANAKQVEILNFLHGMKSRMEEMDTGYRAHGVNMSVRIKTIEAIIEAIKGENK